MKKLKSLKCFKKVLFVFAFVLSLSMMVPTISPVVTQAAAKKIIYAKENYKKCSKLKKGKNYIVDKKNNGFTKFVAPSKGKYKFTFYNFATLGMKPGDADIACGKIYIDKPGRTGYPLYAKVKTEGGKSDKLYVTTQYAYNTIYYNQAMGINAYLTSRSTTLSLKKGQTIYIEYDHDSSAGSHKSSYIIDIKKK